MKDEQKTKGQLMNEIADLEPGDHLCCLCETEEEHRAVLTPFLCQGLERNEKVLYIVDAHIAETVLGYLRDDGLEVEPYLASGQLSILTADDTYMREGVFDPDGMIALLRAETERAQAEGYPALRVTGEMTWALRGLPGSERLIEYEAKLNHFFPGSNCLSICQYNRRRFDPVVLLDVLYTHPRAVIGTKVYDNLYYIPPAEFLGRDRPVVELRRWVENLAERKRAEDGLKEYSERLEEMVEQRTKELLQAQKMNAIGILVSGVAHEFNNLLGAIQGYAELAMMQVDEPDPLHTDLQKIVRIAERGGKLTDQLLLYGRKHPMEPTLLNINRTVSHLLEMVNRLIGEDIAINIDLEPDLWTVRADEASIEQVIMNLVVNAREAMPKGGNFTIKIENVTLDEETCKVIPEARPGKFVCLSVADTGVGMDEEIIQHIFEPFFTTKEVGKGAGLGLSVVYGIVKQHEGWINVYSEPGQGSTFKVYLPALTIKPEDEIEETISLQDLQGSGERILLVEDEEDVRGFLTRALGENGYIVFGAANAKEAIDIFEREKGEFHLVFADVVLPDLSGLQLVDQLLSRNPQLRVLLSSGYTDDRSQWPVIRERGFPFLQKPYSLVDLLQATRDAMESS